MKKRDVDVGHDLPPCPNIVQDFLCGGPWDRCESDTASNRSLQWPPPPPPQPNVPGNISQPEKAGLQHLSAFE